MMTTAAAAQQPMRFPEVEGRNLEGREFSLPKDFGGAPTVVIVAFKRQQQGDAESWGPALKREAIARPALRVYELPVLAKHDRMLRWMIDGGMKRGIKDKRVRETTVTLYLDKKPFDEALGIVSEEMVHVFVLEADGRVRWHGTGAHSAEGEAALVRALGA